MRREKILITAVTVLVCFGLACVPVFALPASAKSEYVPTIPEFLSVTAGAVSITKPYDKESSTAQAFFKDFYDGPYLIMISQETWNDYIPPVKPGSGSAIKQTYVGEDKHWSLIFLKAKTNSFYFSVMDPDASSSAAIRSMPVSLSAGSGTFDMLTYNYDFSKKSFSAPRRESSKSGLLCRLSYVIGSSSAPSVTYNYNRETGILCSADKKQQAGFEIANGHSTEPDQPLYYYNWWIGKRNVTDSFPPDSGSSSGTSSGGSSSGGSSSEPEKIPEHMLTIHYRFRDGSTAAPSYRKAYKEGEAYSVDNPEVPGYPRVRPAVRVSGTMGTQDIVEIVMYFESASDQQGWGGPWYVHLYYLYEDGTEAFPSEQIEITGGEGISYKNPPDLEGYRRSSDYFSWSNRHQQHIYFTFIYYKKGGGNGSSDTTSSGSSSGGSTSGGTSSGGSSSGGTSSGGSSSGGSSSGGTSSGGSSSGGASSGGGCTCPECVPSLPEVPPDIGEDWGTSLPDPEGFDFPLFNPYDSAYPYEKLPTESYNLYDGAPSANYPLVDPGGWGTGSVGGILVNPPSTDGIPYPY